MASNDNTFISFKIGNIDFCVNVQYVVSILEHSTCTEVAHSHDCVEGMVQYLDNIVTQIDLHKYLLSSKRDKSVRHSLIVYNEDDCALAFKVDSINGIYEVGSNDMYELDSVLSSSKKVISNVFNYKGTLNQVLNMKSIRSSILGDLNND